MRRFLSPDEAIQQLSRAGWSVGEIASVSLAGTLWLVSGRNGENLIRAEGSTQAEAWQRACQQAEAVGMLGRSKQRIGWDWERYSGSR